MWLCRSPEPQPANTLPGAAPGAAPSAVPGAAPGAASGAAPGAAPGAVPGARGVCRFSVSHHHSSPWLQVTQMMHSSVFLKSVVYCELFSCGRHLIYAVNFFSTLIS